MIMMYPSCCPVANANDANRPGMRHFGKSAVLASFPDGIELEWKKQTKQCYDI